MLKWDSCLADRMDDWQDGWMDERIDDNGMGKRKLNTNWKEGKEMAQLEIDKLYYVFSESILNDSNVSFYFQVWKNRATKYGL